MTLGSIRRVWFGNEQYICENYLKLLFSTKVLGMLVMVIASSGLRPDCNYYHILHATCCCPNTHLQSWRSPQPTWCVLGGTNLSLDPLSPRSRPLSSRLTPREAKGVDPIKLCEVLLLRF
jgi:hypothetical protein